VSRDELAVLAIAAGCVVATGLVGQLVVRRLRTRGLPLLLGAISCVVLVAVTSALTVDAHVMFLSSHDVVVVLLTVAVALPLSWLLAVWLARDVGLGAQALRRTARSLGDAEPPQAAPVASRELAGVQDELLAADRALRAARESERAAESSRRELVAWVSHDLRTPLAGIRAMAEALEDGVLDDPGEYHKRLRVESDRLADMVDTLFLLSRLHAGALALTTQPLDLRDLVSDAVATVRPVAEARGVRLTGDVPVGLVASVDAGQLSRALGNLLMNGLRHTGSGGEVAVTAGRDEGTVLVAVQDACGGIADDDLARVFDLAWRGRSARSTGPDGGGGLGLTVVQGIVAAHGGTVSVSNHPPGCRFEIRLPALPQ